MLFNESNSLSMTSASSSHIDVMLVLRKLAPDVPTFIARDEVRVAVVVVVDVVIIVVRVDTRERRVGKTAERGKDAYAF